MGSGQYNVIINFKAAMTNKQICNACETLYDKTTNVTKLSPCVQLLKNTPSIVVHVQVVF